MVGAMWSRMVVGPVIHSTVPSVRLPASRSICSPSAATSTGTRSSLGTLSCRLALTVSPLKDTGCPSASGISTSRYSRRCRTGRAKS
ncbi:Uncharacterised protein [Mycobacteroides abscessus subsp. abscessus]|nr:Uncharacterised protein [Mycobacteroides abscessus subsp. abscessus]